VIFKVTQGHCCWCCLIGSVCFLLVAHCNHCVISEILSLISKIWRCGLSCICWYSPQSICIPNLSIWLHPLQRYGESPKIKNGSCNPSGLSPFGIVRRHLASTWYGLALNSSCNFSYLIRIWHAITALEIHQDLWHQKTKSQNCCGHCCIVTLLAILIKLTCELWQTDRCTR